MTARIVTALCAFLLAAAAAPPRSQAAPIEPSKLSEGDYVVPNFHFASGEALPELRLHYTVLGKPHRNERGHIDNAVLILHGTGGTGRGFLADRFGGVLFGKGQLLDASRYFIILPDAVGHGMSSKPSDGLHARFPQYSYEDMVAAQYVLLTQGLQVDHLRLLIGTSMGCMQGWIWGESHPDFLDALMPLACLPAPIAGRNRVWRELIMDAIRSDPEWQNGDYKFEPAGALRLAASLLLIARSAPIEMQKLLPTRDAADEFVAKYLGREIPELDANDLLYQMNASRDYDPSAGLEKIRASVMWINSADDFVDPPELGVAEQAIKRVRNGRFVLLPASDQTHGHGTHSWPALWQQYLKQLLDSPPPP